MQLCLLHLDDALREQPDFISNCERNGAHQLHAEQIGAQIRLWGTDSLLEPLAALLRGQCASMGRPPTLWFMGSGDFHHVSALLITQALEAESEPVTVIHFDNHPDWVHFNSGMHCGSWVNRVAAHPKVAKIITLGVSSKDLNSPEFRGANLSLIASGKLELYPFWHPPSRVRRQYGKGAAHEQRGKYLHWKTIAEEGESPFLAQLLSRIGTNHVYLTIDKDVLCAEDAVTNWDQGSMRLSYLLEIIRAIGVKHRIIGADVTGDYSAPVYRGNLWTRVKKRLEIMIDQSCTVPNKAKALQINSAGNHALLELFQEVMA